MEKPDKIHRSSTQRKRITLRKRVYDWPASHSAHEESPLMKSLLSSRSREDSALEALPKDVKNLS